MMHNLVVELPDELHTRLRAIARTFSRTGTMKEYVTRVLTERVETDEYRLRAAFQTDSPHEHLYELDEESKQ